MGLLRINNGPFQRIGDRYSTLFGSDHFMGRTAFEDGWLTAKTPANIKKKKESTILELAMPGFKKEEITIEVRDNCLFVKAKKTSREDDAEIIEEGLPQFIPTQVIPLEKHIDQDHIAAKLERGILKLRMPHTTNAVSMSKAIRVA
ncbi:MAG: Hsp20/alpha crystallin family protein [Fulvivirga sp.]|nr:Hsp20/alpha crystallin family protein [Fulvivirga sp.]